MSPTITTTASGIRVGPTSGGNHYLARDDHQHFAHSARNRWNDRCLPLKQFELLEAAESNGWTDSRSHLWAVGTDFQEIGTDGERIAKFPERANHADDWHGYPVSALDPKRAHEHRPEPELVSRWYESGLITQVQRARIKRGKI